MSSAALPNLTADTLLAPAQVARALRWRVEAARQWLELNQLLRNHPDGRRSVVRWGDVLEAIPREGQEPARKIAPAPRRRRTLARGSY